MWNICHKSPQKCWCASWLTKEECETARIPTVGTKYTRWKMFETNLGWSWVSKIYIRPVELELTSVPGSQVFKPLDIHCVVGTLCIPSREGTRGNLVGAINTRKFSRGEARTTEQHTTHHTHTHTERSQRHSNTNCQQSAACTALPSGMVATTVTLTCATTTIVRCLFLSLSLFHSIPSMRKAELTLTALCNRQVPPGSQLPPRMHHTVTCSATPSPPRVCRKKPVPFRARMRALWTDDPSNGGGSLFCVRNCFTAHALHEHCRFSPLEEGPVSAQRATFSLCPESDCI